MTRLATERTSAIATLAALCSLAACGGEDLLPKASEESAAFPTGPQAAREPVTATPGSEIQATNPVEFAWHVIEPPILSIGDSDSGPTVPLYEVGAIVPLANGSIAVADGVPRILLFDQDGSHLRTVGREGDGPGEFREIAWMQPLPPDSLLVYDSRLGRLSYFTVEGELGRVLTPPEAPSGRIPNLVGILDDRRLVGRETLLPTEPPTGSSYLIRTDLRLTLHSQDGSYLHDLGTTAGDEFAIVQGVRVFASQSMFTRTTLIAVAGREVYAAPSDTFGAVVIDDTGARTRSMFRPHEPVPITNVDMYERAALAGVEIPRPEAFPAISALVVDGTGHVWVAPFVREPTGPLAWSVFDPAGELLGEVEMPEGFWPRHIREDRVLGVWSDDLGVEQVLIFRLSRGGR